MPAPRAPPPPLVAAPPPPPWALGGGCEAARVVTCLGQQRTNMFTIASNQHVQHAPDTEGNAIIGAGCYPRAAILNHSCAPNCVLAFGEGGFLHVRTACDVAAGAAASARAASGSAAARRQNRRAEEGIRHLACGVLMIGLNLFMFATLLLWTRWRLLGTARLGRLGS